MAKDEAVLTELERLGTLTTPVTVIREGGEEKEEVVVGFDREKLKGLLRL